MPPDLNSLPPSRTTHVPSRATGPGPHSPQGSSSLRPSMHSLASAAALNAADLSRDSSTGSQSRRSGERRRSIIALNINQNDPTIPAPGEFVSGEHHPSFTHQYSSNSPSTIGGTRAIASGDPHHQRTPSLGELHQELEEEQEAQVNRMLLMIRQQQSELERLRTQPDSAAASRQSSQPVSATAAILDDLIPASEPASFRTSSNSASHPHDTPRLPNRRSSASQSPALHAVDSTHSSDIAASPSTSTLHHHRHSLLENATSRRNSMTLRDETTYYQAETASLTRENQLLRQRIRELERQLSEGNGTATTTTDTTSAALHASRHSSHPVVHSPLIPAQDKS